MDTDQLSALLTRDGLRLLDELPPIHSTDDVLREVSRLRAQGYSPDLVSAVVEQARLRVRGAEKFGDLAGRMLFTRQGLEQATRISVAVRHGARFRSAGLEQVTDLGCGIGGDALAFAGLGLRVRAVEADEATAALAAYNLAPFGEEARVEHAKAEDVTLAPGAPVWLDPARRTADGTRLGRHDEWSPPLEWVFPLLAGHPGGVKLSPAFDRSAIPPDVEAQWISADGSTVELVLWSGALARPGVDRAALVIRGTRATELTGAGPTADAEIGELRAYLHEPAGSVIRAQLIGDVARSVGGHMLAPGIAYFSTDDSTASPFTSSFRVREELPVDTRALGSALRARGIGTLEIKKRGFDIDPAVLRRKLKLRGDDTATLILTRTQRGRTAILADRVVPPEAGT